MRHRIGSVGREVAVAAVLFVLALMSFVLFQRVPAQQTARPATLLMFVLLAGGYILLGVEAARAWLARRLVARSARLALGPLLLWVACVAYSAAAGLAVTPRALAYGVYLVVPTLLLAWAGDDSARRVPWRELAAATFLGLAIKYHMLPGLPVPAPDGFDASRLIGLVAGLYLFLVGRPTAGVGYTWALSVRDFVAAVIAFLVFALAAVPVGLGTHFLVWHPRAGLTNDALQPIVIYLVTGVPEEFLFRGLIQNFLTRWLGNAGGLVLASVIFGLSHLPDPRYAFLATLAGLAYGWVYLRTSKVTASGLTHALVDAAWLVLLRR